MVDCNHTHEIEEYVEDPDAGLYESYSSQGSEWITRYESACVDLDLHHYKCTLCGFVGCYGSNY